MERITFLDEVLRYLMSGGTCDAPRPDDDERDDPFTLALTSLMLTWRSEFPAAVAAARQALETAADADAVALARAVAELAGGHWPAYRNGSRPVGPVGDADDDIPSPTDAVAWPVYTLLAEAALANARVDRAAAFLARAGTPPDTLFGAPHPFVTFIRTLIARVAVFEGDVARAEHFADAAVADATGDAEALFALGCSALTHGSADRRMYTRSLVEQVTVAPDPVDALTRGCFVLASYGARALGDLERAANLVLRAGGDADLSALRIIDRAFGLESLVASALDLGDADAAESWLARLEKLAKHPIAAPAAERARSRVALATGDADAALHAAERARSLAATGSREVERAEAEILTARARIATHQAGAAAKDLASLVTASEAHGYRAVRRSAARELRRVGRRLPPIAASGWSGLSDREREVALLLAKGLSNAALAEELFLSPHTVRTHVTRVLCAFGVANRAGVAAALARQGLGPADADRPSTLTARQREIVALISTGATNPQIALDLNLSISTVEKHVSAIMDRWHARSRAEVAHLAELQEAAS